MLRHQLKLHFHHSVIPSIANHQCQVNGHKSQSYLDLKHQLQHLKCKIAFSISPHIPITSPAILTNLKNIHFLPFVRRPASFQVSETGSQASTFTVITITMMSITRTIGMKLASSLTWSVQARSSCPPATWKTPSTSKAPSSSSSSNSLSQS